MCAEIESVVTRLIRERIEAGCSDQTTSNFLNSMRRNVVRNAKYSELCDKLALFGQQYKEKFVGELESTIGEEGIQKLGIAVGKRDDDAHRQPPDITFRELEEVYGVATIVVDVVWSVLQT